MSSRLALVMVLLAAVPAAAQPLAPPPLVLANDPPPPTPAVTFGSLALSTNGDPCKAVGFSPDGRAVTLFGQQHWRRWDIATGTAADGKAGSLDFGDTLYPTPDGLAVLCVGRTEGRNGKVRVLDLKNGFELRAKTFDPTDTLVPSDDGTAIAVAKPRAAVVHFLDDKTPELRVEGAADVRRFAKAAAAGTFALLGDDRVTVNTPAGLWKLDPPKNVAYTSVALTADGGTLVTASALETDDGKRPGPIELWDVKGRQKLRTAEPVEWFAEAPHRLRFTPDGKTLVAGDGAYLRGWATATGAKTFAAEPGWGWVGNVQISPDGKHVAVAYAGRPMVYELATGRQPAALLGHSSAVWDVAFSPDGGTAATAMFGRPTVYLWDAATGRYRGEVQAAFRRPADGGRVVPGRVRVQFSPDGSKLLTTSEASGGGTPVRVWDAKTLGLLRDLPAPEADAATVAFTRHGLFAVLDRKPTLLDPDTGKVLWEKPPVPRGARAVVSRDRVAVEGRTATAVWAAADGTEWDRVAGEPVSFTLGGDGLIVEGKKAAAKYRDLAAKKDGPTVENSAADPERFATSATGLVAMRMIGPNGMTFRISLARTGLPLTGIEPNYPNHFDPALVFSPDGRTFAVAGPEVFLYETYSGEEVCRRPGGLPVRTAVFSRDGRTFFTSRGDEDTGSQVLGWDATGGTGEAVAVAQADEVEKLTTALGDKPAAARQALYRLATRPADAVAFARDVTRLPTAADEADYARWLSELDAPAYATREAATKGLAKGGWRAEAVMRRTLAATESVEARTRLEKLLARRDVRPLRAVHLLEVVGTPAAVAVLKGLAAGPADSLVVQDAKWSLLRLAERPK